MSRTLATVFGLGRLRPGPGTWGAAAAVPLAWVLHGLGGFPLLAAATAAVFALGWWATAAATRGKADHDPEEIVIDEVVGQWVALWPLSLGLWWIGTAPWSFPWPGWVGAFALFRLFDIRKTWPVCLADRRDSPLAVMLDDVIAGAMAAAVVAAAGALAHLVLLA